MIFRQLLSIPLAFHSLINTFTRCIKNIQGSNNLKLTTLKSSLKLSINTLLKLGAPLPRHNRKISNIRDRKFWILMSLTCCCKDDKAELADPVRIWFSIFIGMTFVCLLLMILHITLIHSSVFRSKITARPPGVVPVSH